MYFLVDMKRKVKVSCTIMSDSVIPWTAACSTPPSKEFSRQEYWSGLPFPSPGGLPHPGIEPRSPTLQADSLPTEPLGKPKNTGVGSLSFLQQIFLTQELNQGLLHCREILYQLNYPESLVVTSRAYSLIVVHRLLSAVASVVAAC